mmetsp:Transcript_34134/g.57356  ORF Transcript_34134/g.57356 Transcript_34134/m.57356 type:complete len:388 (+) Transcript_34134:142-1305(+)
MPPSKKQKVEEPVITDVGSLPRVTYSMSLTALRNECKVRELKSCSTLPKESLVGKLIEGTICIGETREYKAYRSLLGLVKKEEAEKKAKKEYERELERERSQRESVEFWERRERINRERQEEQSRARAEEMQSQVRFHTNHDFPALHSCPLASTEILLFHGKARVAAVCEGSWNNPEPCDNSLWTCEKCDFDICASCCTWQAKPLASRNKVVEAARKRRSAEEAAILERRREEATKIKRKAKEDEAKFDKSIGGPFPAKIINPSVSCKNQSQTEGFTVWSSCGYGNDGWHSHNARPEMEYDSTYPCESEAKKRAKYLFFKKNTYGLDYQDMSDEYGSNKNSWTLKDCQVNADPFCLRIAPPDSEVWTVGVLPATAFRNIVEDRKMEY